MLNKIRSLPLEQKIGQLFFIGIPGAELDNEVVSLLEKVPAGGVCLFTRNIKNSEQTRKLNDDLVKILPIPPILSLDQEGGLVDRLRRVITPMPSVSVLKTSQNVETLALLTAEVLRILGFNTNFAPVVDIPTKTSISAQNGLQSRYFADNLEEVIELARIYLVTLQKNGIIGCPKHFPGIGAIEVDSHEELPYVGLSFEQLEKNDLVPYQIMSQHIHQIMVGHTSFPKLDLQEKDSNGKLLPSSLSYNFVTNLLRQQLGFQKTLVVTDDLEMGAILKNYDIGRVCKMAVKAGVDMLLICASQDEILKGFSALSDAVRSGEISEDRIDESLQRIARYKNLIHPPLEFNQTRLNELSDEIQILNENVK